MSNSARAFHPDHLDPILWQVMERLDGDVGRLGEAVAGLNRGALGRLGWNFELAGSALTDERFRVHMASDLDEAEEQDLGG